MKKEEEAEYLALVTLFPPAKALTVGTEFSYILGENSSDPSHPFSA